MSDNDMDMGGVGDEQNDLDNTSLGWDRFAAVKDFGWTWDIPIETGTGNLTEEEAAQIHALGLYGHVIDSKSIEALKSGTPVARKPFTFRGRASDGAWEKEFDSKEELIAHAKEYPGYPYGHDGWVDDDGRHFDAEGVPYNEIFGEPVSPASVESDFAEEQTYPAPAEEPKAAPPSAISLAMERLAGVTQAHGSDTDRASMAELEATGEDDLAKWDIAEAWRDSATDAEIVDALDDLLAAMIPF